jgi:large subunit ribosomal protein L13
MSTFMPTAESITRKWYVIDAAGKPVGRVAAAAAVLLRGKHKTTFVTHLDCGDHVIVLNAEKAVLTGNKLDKKFYRHHSLWVGHLKEVSYRTLMSSKPEKAIELAVKGMIPATVIGRSALSRLRVYRGGEHEQTAQKPEEWKI